jgi:hypothetical protein
MKCGFISMPQARADIATICTHYLTFEVFESNLYSDDLALLLTRGDASFQDYAVAHWAQHVVEATVDTTHPVPTNYGLRDGMEQFAESYCQDFTVIPGSTEQDRPDMFPSYQQPGDKVSETRRLAISAIRRGEDQRDQVCPGSLSTTLTRNRSSLQNLAISREMRAIYGGKLHKCPRVTCYFFHAGFESKNELEHHCNKHERPFCCVEEDCESATIGFASEKELSKHKRVAHPGIDKLSLTFARLKKEKDGPPGFACDNCGVNFQNGYLLRRHTRGWGGCKRKCGRCGYIVKHADSYRQRMQDAASCHCPADLRPKSISN